MTIDSISPEFSERTPTMPGTIPSGVIPSGVYYQPIENSSGSIIFPSPYNVSIHNTLDSFTGQRLVELPDDIKKKTINLNIKFIEWEIDEHKKQWNQQRIFGYIIFGIVILLTIAGIALSAYQLVFAIKLKEFNSLVAEFGFDNANKIYLKTSIVGTTILAISIAFFYLFLQYIFKTKSKAELIHRELLRAAKTQ